MAACRHCKSPDRWNPCWYGITIAKGADPGGADPPCLGDMYDEEQAALNKKEWSSYIGAFVLLIVIAIVCWRLS